MYKIAIGDNLLIMQSSLVPTLPWGYRIIDLISNTIIESAIGIADDYKLIAIDSATYAAYEGKTLLLELIDNVGDLIEDDTFLISGIYGKYTEIKYIIGLLGENISIDSSLNTDYQDGHETHNTKTIYTSSSLATSLASYEYNKSFVTDFKPDARYQTKSIVQSKN